MAIIKSSSSSSTEKNNFDLFREKDNIKDYKDLLSTLKSDVLASNGDDIAQLFKEVDEHIENFFDNNWSKNPENKKFILDNINNPKAIEEKFTKDAKEYSKTFMEKLEELEILDATNGFTLELNALSLDVLKSSITNTTADTNSGGADGGGNSDESGGLYGENTRVNSHYQNNSDGSLKVGTLSYGNSKTETGHNENELAHNGVGDVLYTGFTYLENDTNDDPLLSKRQIHRNEKSGDVFDPTADQKYRYKNKDIEYRDKNRQVYKSIIKIMGDFTKVDKHGHMEKLDLRDVRGLDRTKIPNILYLITRDDRMKEHNRTYDDDESTGSDLGAWKVFVNTSNDGIDISPEKVKEFKRLLGDIDYKGSNIKKLITFLNFFSNGDTIPYMNKIADIGSRKGKSGRMQLIETGNVSKLIDNIKAGSLGNSWTDDVEKMRGQAHAETTAMNSTIEPIERTGNFFSFICDLNNDGRVDQYDLSSSLTGFAFYGMLMSVCDVKKSGKGFEIVNGPQTSTVLRNMLEKAYGISHNVNLRTEIRSLLRENSLVHTYHVLALMKKYPEIKPFMIYDIQAETEYAQSTRSIQNTYEAFNPDAANSLLRNGDTDPIEDYFIGEAIKDAMGDLYNTNINELKAIAAKEGITLNRKVDVDVLRAMNVLVSTVFMNFGPLMRAMQYDRLQAGHNDPGYTGQYNPGNAHFAIEGKIPLSKEDFLKTPWSSQGTKEFIKSTTFKKRLKTTSINPLLGISTYSDSEGKTQPSPVLGIGISFDKSKLDPSGKRASHFTQIGLSYDVMDMQLFAGLNGSNVRQTNNRKLKDNLDTAKPYVKGLGVQYSVGGALDIKNPMQSGLFASMGPLYQVDHLAGLDQVSRNFEMFFNPFIKPIDAKFLTAKLSTESDWNKLYIDLENHYLDRFSSKYKGPKYLHLTESMIHLFVGHLQEQNLLENIGHHDLSVSDKQKIVQAYMGQRIDGFTSSLYQSELAKLNARGLKLSKLGAKVGANLTVESLLHGGPIGVLFSANLSFSAHNEVYGDDPHDINSVSKQLDYGAGMKSLDIPAGSNLEDIAYKLENAFAIKDLSIQVDNGTLIFKNKSGSILDLLHLYYTKDALHRTEKEGEKDIEKSGFSFDGKKLIVGDVGKIGIANILKGMTKAHYLILGDDKMIGCLEHKKYTKTPGANKGDKPSIKWDKLQQKDKNGDALDVTSIGEKSFDILPTFEEIKKQVMTLPDGVEKTILSYLGSVNKQGELVLNISKTTPATLQGISQKNGEYVVPATGTLSFIKDKNDKITIVYTNTPNNKLTISYKELISEVATRVIPDKTEIMKIHLDVSDLFSHARKTLDTHSARIKSFDSIHRTTFFEFLSAAKNLDGGGIDHNDYVAALAAITGPLTKHINNDEFTTTINNATGEELVYIVDRLKAIFADNYSFKTYTDVQQTIRNRGGETYQKILGPSGLPVPNDIYDIRESFKTHPGSMHISEKTNLLGYTARYRKGGKEKNARGYSSTAYGHTNVFDGFIREIPDKKESQAWMIANLEKDKTNLDTITATINKSLKSQGIHIDTNNLLEILKTGKTSIDKSNKILKINVKWYFYLLAECANESLGLALDGDATIITTKPDETTKYSTPHSTTITPTKKSGSTLAISKTTKTIDLDVRAKKGDINFVGQGSVQVGGWKENGGQGNEEETGGQGTNEEPRTENDDGGQGTNEGGGG